MIPYQDIQNKIKGALYFGIRTIKNPMDFWVYREIIYEQKPDVIVEIGNFCGGSTLALAHICQLIGNGRVIGVDLSHSRMSKETSAHPLVTLIKGDACEVFDKVRSLIKEDETVLVIEDSSHSKDNTLAVLKTYSPLVKSGGYFIVEDSIIKHGIDGSGDPAAAINSFIDSGAPFDIDNSREWPITWNHNGYLKKR